jgi:hypothetical protein
MIVRMIATTVGLDPCDAGGATGAGAPVVDISPARPVAESAHANAITNANRFIVGFLLRVFESCKPFCIELRIVHTQTSCST